MEHNKPISNRFIKQNLTRTLIQSVRPICSHTGCPTLSLQECSMTNTYILGSLRIWINEEIGQLGLETIDI